MKFISTRNENYGVSGAEAIARGLSPDGGLFVPESFPKVSAEELESYSEKSYNELAAIIIGKFLPEFDKLPEFVEKAYSRFDEDGPAPTVKTGEGTYMLELWHGPTCAFKDVALTLLPYLLTESKKMLGKREHTLVLTATSGDTGKAALEGFRDVDGASVMVFYPSEGVSELQKLQMTTQRGNNVSVKAIRGNFDDAQRAVKNIFTDEGAAAELNKKGIALCSANSINFGRLVPQIVYYFSAYSDLVSSGETAPGDKVNFCVPTGNFGDILAGWYAYNMGLPVGRLICASNRNDVLADFIATGKYDSRREFHKTTSPSMDILVSSNLERLIFELAGRSGEVTRERMNSLARTGEYSITEAELKNLRTLFRGGSADEERTARAIADTFDETGYLMDPHTAVAKAVYEDYAAEEGDRTPTVILGTASPYKFAPAVLSALGETVPSDPAAAMEKLEDLSALPIPNSLKELTSLTPRFKDIIDKEEAKAAVLGYEPPAAE